MARRIRWQLVIAVLSGLVISALLGTLALSSTAVARPLAGGGYVEGAVGAMPARVNPLLDDPQSNPLGYDLAALLFDGLMRVGADGLPERGLAQEWSVDESGLVYTFALRRGLLWHDGVPVSADDVLFTLRALQTPRFPGDPALTNFWRAVLVDRIDDYTLRITLNAPYAPFLSAARLPILPAHLLGTLPVEQWLAAPFNQRPVGSGPYRLVELNAERALLAANPNYYGGKPLIDSIELRFFSTPEAALVALEQGLIQGLGYEPMQLGRDVALPRSVRGYRLPLDGYTMLSFNSRSGPLADAALRRALARGLDKQALLAAALPGQAVRLDTPILPGWWAYDPGVAWYPADTAAAARALSELGYSPGADGVLANAGTRLALPLLTDGAPDHLEIAQQIAQQWGALGVQVPIEQLDGPELRARLRAHDFALALHSFSRLGPDPDQYELWHSSQATDGLNYAGLQDDELDTLIAAGRGEFELTFRSDEYSAFQERWVELAPAILLYQPLYAYAAVPQLGGTGFDQAELASSAVLFGRADRYRTITRWFINSSREIRGDLRRPE